MRRQIFLLVLMIFFGTMLIQNTAFSQTLQFSKILLVSNTTDTVPAGKVWKMESLLQSQFSVYYGNSNCNNYGNYAIYINGTKFYINTYLSLSNNADQPLSSGRTLPFWLPAGTTLKTYCSQTLLSVIEFKVIP